MTQRRRSDEQVLSGARTTEAVERQVSGRDRDARFILSVVEDGGSPRAMIVLCARPSKFEEHRARLAKSKVKAVREQDWARLNLDPCNVTAFIRGGCLSEISAEYRENLPGGFRNRRSRILTDPPQPVTPLWMDAALARRAVIALVSADALDVPDEAWDGDVPAPGPDVLMEQIRGEARARRLWAGLMNSDLGVIP